LLDCNVKLRTRTISFLTGLFFNIQNHHVPIFNDVLFIEAARSDTITKEDFWATAVAGCLRRLPEAGTFFFFFFPSCFRLHRSYFPIGWTQLSTLPISTNEKMSASSMKEKFTHRLFAVLKND
jgi:hypothetical protein